MMAWLSCPNCGTVYIDDPDQLTIWASLDNDYPICEYTCRCGAKVEDKITVAAANVAARQGVNIRPFNEKYLTLSEEDIQSWDIDKELSQIGLI